MSYNTSVRTVRVLLLALGVVLGGCGTIGNLSDDPKIYGGLRNDIEEVGRPTGPCNPGFLMACDVPFSFVLDTVLLPFTVLYELFSGH